MKTRQARPFADENCFPRTVAMAHTYRALLEPMLDKDTISWPYADRVLFFAAPDFREEAQAFHQQQGPDLPAMFEHEQLSRFDALMTKLLFKTLRSR